MNSKVKASEEEIEMSRERKRFGERMEKEGCHGWMEGGGGGGGGGERERDHN